MERAPLTSSGRVVGRLKEVPLYLLGEPNDPLYPAQGEHFRVAGFSWERIPWNAPLACRPLVAVVDGGFYPNHPDLQGNVVWAGSSFPENPSPRPDGGSEPHHGTMVAGLVGARTGNAQGIASFSAGRAGLLLYRVFAANARGEEEGSVEALARALLDAADQGANVINLSLGTPVDPGLAPLMDYLWAKGVVVVAAAGNNGGELWYPARYPTVIAVGATRLVGGLTFYSSRDHGEHPAFVSAPVDDGILSLGGSPRAPYRQEMGTSFASPQVAGGLALWWAYRYGKRGMPPSPSEVLACLNRAKRPSDGQIQWQALFASDCP